MKNYILCPKCGHRAFTRFGVVIKAFIYSSIGVDYSLSRPVFIPIRKKGEKWNNSFPNLADLLNAGHVLSFSCYKCDRNYPKKMQPEIFDYLKQKIILLKLKS